MSLLFNARGYRARTSSGNTEIPVPWRNVPLLLPFSNTGLPSPRMASSLPCSRSPWLDTLAKRWYCGTFSDLPFAWSEDVSWKCLDISDGSCLIITHGTRFVWWENRRRRRRSTNFGPSAPANFLVRRTAFWCRSSVSLLAPRSSPPASMSTFRESWSPSGHRILASNRVRSLDFSSPAISSPSCSRPPAAA